MSSRNGKPRPSHYDSPAAAQPEVSLVLPIHDPLASRVEARHLSQTSGAAKRRRRAQKYRDVLLPSGLAEDYEDALADPGLHSLDEEAALVEVLLADAIHHWASAEAGDWARAERLWTRFRTNPSPDVVSQLDAIFSEEATRKGAHDRIMDLLDMKRKLSDSKGKLLQIGARSVEATKVLAMIKWIVAIVREVCGEDLARAVGERLAESGLIQRQAAPVSVSETDTDTDADLGDFEG